MNEQNSGEPKLPPTASFYMRLTDEYEKKVKLLVDQVSANHPNIKSEELLAEIMGQGTYIPLYYEEGARYPVKGFADVEEVSLDTLDGPYLEHTNGEPYPFFELQLDFYADGSPFVYEEDTAGLLDEVGNEYPGYSIVASPELPPFLVLEKKLSDIDKGRRIADYLEHSRKSGEKLRFVTDEQCEAIYGVMLAQPLDEELTLQCNIDSRSVFGVLLSKLID